MEKLNSINEDKLFFPFNVILKLLKIEMIRFLIVGGLNTLFGLGVYSLCIFIGFHYSLASLCAIILGILFNFKTTGIIVFNSHDNQLIFKFALIYFVVYIFNVSGLYLLKLIIKNDYVNGVLMIVPQALLAFSLFKFFVFRKAREQK